MMPWALEPMVKSSANTKPTSVSGDAALTMILEQPILARVGCFFALFVSLRSVIRTFDSGTP